MKRDGDANRAWRSRATETTSPISDLLADITRRELSDLETCQRVWEHRQDPLALCEAVRLAGVDEWLRDALLVMLTAGEGGYPDRRRQLWRERAADARDAVRACELAAVRAHPDLPSDLQPLPTWDAALVLAEHFTRATYPQEAPVSAATVKKAYATVQKHRRDPHRYFRARAGMQDLIRGAWMRLLRALETGRAARSAGDTITPEK